MGFTLLCLFPNGNNPSPATPSALRATVSPRRRCTTLEGAALRGKGFSLARRFLCRHKVRDFLSLSRLTPTAPSSEGAKGTPLFCAAPSWRPF